MVGDKANAAVVAQHPNAQLAYWARVPDQGAKPFLIFRPALDAPEVVLSYAEVDRRVSLLAQALWQQGVRPGDVVAMALPDGVDHIILMFALWACQAVYMPLPLEVKEHSLASLQAVKPTWLVHAGMEEPDWFVSLELPTHLLNWETLSNPLDPDAKEVESSVSELPELDVSKAAYLFCSSGSTANPKIISNDLSGVSARMEAVLTILAVSPEEKLRLLGFFERGFDASLFDIFCALYHGGLLYLVPQTVRADSFNQLPDFYSACEPKPNMAVLVPTVLGYLHPAQLSSLTRVITTGQAVELMQVEAWLNAPGVRLWNGYGPTETTIAATVVEMVMTPTIQAQMTDNKKAEVHFPLVARDDVTGALTGVLGGVELWVRTVIETELETGEKSYDYGVPHALTQETPSFGSAPLELLIGGLGVGYYQTNETTLATRFDNYPGAGRCFATRDKVSWDGKALYFQGRFDRQIKRDSVLVNLDGVEQRLEALKVNGVKLLARAIVIALSRPDGSPAIFAFVEPNPAFTDLPAWCERYNHCVASKDFAWRERPDWTFTVALESSGSAKKQRGFPQLSQRQPVLLPQLRRVAGGRRSASQQDLQEILQALWYELTVPGLLRNTAQQETSAGTTTTPMVLSAHDIPVTAMLDTIGGSSLIQSAFLTKVLKFFDEWGLDAALKIRFDADCRQQVYANHSLAELAQVMLNYRYYHSIQWDKLPPPNPVEGDFHYIQLPSTPHLADYLNIYCEQRESVEALTAPPIYCQVAALRWVNATTLWEALNIPQPALHQPLVIMVRDIEKAGIAGYFHDWIASQPELKAWPITWYLWVPAADYAPSDKPAVVVSSAIEVNEVKGSDGETPIPEPDTASRSTISAQDYFGDPAPGPKLYTLNAKDRPYVKVLRSASVPGIPPVFLFYPLTGEAPRQYEKLLESVPKEQAVYALLWPEQSAEAADFTQQVSECQRLVQAVSPAGPYWLVGWSYGGLLAHAVGAQLEGQGQSVIGVVNIDFYYPPELLLGYLRWLQQRDVQKFYRSVNQMIRYFVQLFKGDEALQSKITHAIQQGESLSDPVREAARYFLVAGETYAYSERKRNPERAHNIAMAFKALAFNFTAFARLEKYPFVLKAPMVLYRAEESLGKIFGYPVVPEQDLKEGWDAIAPNHTVITCTGTHFSLLGESDFQQPFQAQLTQWNAEFALSVTLVAQQLRSHWLAQVPPLTQPELPVTVWALAGALPVLDALTLWLNGTQAESYLRGGPGSGKSYAVAAWLKALPETDVHVIPLTLTANSLEETLMRLGLSQDMIAVLKLSIEEGEEKVIFVLDRFHPDSRPTDWANWSNARFLYLETTLQKTQSQSQTNEHVIEYRIQPIAQPVVQRALQELGVTPTRKMYEIVANPLWLGWLRELAMNRRAVSAEITTRGALVKALYQQWQQRVETLPAWQIPRGYSRIDFEKAFKQYAYSYAFYQLTQAEELHNVITAKDPITEHWRFLMSEIAYHPEFLAVHYLREVFDNPAHSQAVSPASALMSRDRALVYLSEPRQEGLRKQFAELLASDYPAQLAQELPVLLGQLLQGWVGRLAIPVAQVRAFIEEKQIQLPPGVDMMLNLMQTVPVAVVLPFALPVVQSELTALFQELMRRDTAITPSEMVSWLNAQDTQTAMGATVRKIMTEAITLALMGPIHPVLERYQGNLDAQARERGWRKLPPAVVTRLEALGADKFACDLEQVRYAVGVDTGHGMVITLGAHIYFPSEPDFSRYPESVGTLLYMLAHVEQFEGRGGIETFVFQYLVEALWQGYQQLFQQGPIDPNFISGFIQRVHDEMPLEQYAEKRKQHLLATYPGLCNALSREWVETLVRESPEDVSEEKGGEARIPMTEERRAQGTSFAQLMFDAVNQLEAAATHTHLQERFQLLSAVLAETTQTVGLDPRGQRQASELTRRALSMVQMLRPFFPTAAPMPMPAAMPPAVRTAVPRPPASAVALARAEGLAPASAEPAVPAQGLASVAAPAPAATLPSSQSQDLDAKIKLTFTAAATTNQTEQQPVAESLDELLDKALDDFGL